MKEMLMITLFRLMASMPFSICRKVGGWLGQLVFRFDRSTGSVVNANLKHCMPELLEACGSNRRVKVICEQTGMTASESAWMWLNPADKTLAKVQRVHGEEILKDALEQSGSVVLAAPHLGNWEALGIWLGKRFEIYSMYRPPKLKGLDVLMRSGRESSGAHLVPADSSGVRRMLKGVKNGGIAAILPDQEPAAGEGVFAPFFGIEAYTMTLIVKLVQKLSSPLIMGYALRVEGGFDIHFVRVDTIRPEDDLRTAAAALNQAIEQQVRQHPQQYQWTYKRFKSRPEGEQNFY